MSRSIHARHAEIWGLPSPWAAEWMFNIFKHCSTPEGNAAYCAWMRSQYGEKDGNDRMRKCKEPGPPRRLYELSREERVIFRIATDLTSVTGIHCYPGELKLYQEFCNATRTALPPQMKDAPSRRKGETAEDWFFRRDEGILEGRRFPEMDWQLCRAIAISELDRVRDDYAAMRADSQLFTERVLSRRESIIPSAEIIEIGRTAPDYLWIRTTEDAWRSITLLQHLAHSAWSQAAALFEDLATRGITTPRALERTYKKEVELAWRLLRIFTAVAELERNMVSQVEQIITHSEYYRPWFKRYRTLDGWSHIEVDKEAVKARPPADSLDEAVLKCCITGVNKSPLILFWRELKLATKRDARIGQRFSAAVYQFLGDFAIVQDFFVNVYESPWGQTFNDYATSLLSACPNEEMVSRLAFMQLGPDSPSPVQPRYKYGRASSVSDDQCERWIGARNSDAIYFGPEFGDGSFTLTNFWTKHTALFDPLLLRIDTHLWSLASRLDKPGQAGTVARLYGLLDPTDPDRLTAAKRRERKLLEQSPTPQTTPAPAASLYKSSIPVAVPGVKDEAAVSGHQYTAEAESEGSVKSKKKKKKKGKTTGKELDTEASVDGITSSLEKTRIVQEIAQPEAEQPYSVNLDDVPDVLPSKFVLPRKMAKIIHRLLDGRYDDDFSKVDSDAPAKGEVRWQDFEKVMRRIGFQVVQTAGSSVRFDPPAKTARPISFHRPHPDAIIPHIMAKWYGARLSRVYGWTMSTFEAKAGAEKDDVE